MNPDIWPQLKNEIHNKFVAYEYVDTTDHTLSEFIVGLMRVGKTPEELSNELQLLVGQDYDPNVTEWFFGRKQSLEAQESTKNKESNSQTTQNIEKDTPMSAVDHTMSDSIVEPSSGKQTPEHVEPRARLNRDDRIFSKAIGSALNPNKERQHRERRFSPIRYRSRSRSRSPERNSARVISREERHTIVENKSSGTKAPTRIAGIASSSGKNSRRSVFDRLGTVNTSSAKPEEDSKSQRCKYWPTCKNGDQCVYFHPDTVCPDFPQCPNKANECMFIHPETQKPPHATIHQPVAARLPYPCKFFPYCSNPVCPYIHPLPQQSYYMQAQPSYPNSQRVPIPCKNGNGCTRPNCHFLHPKDETSFSETICKYDGSCTRPNCFYKHTKENTAENTKNKVFIKKTENTNIRQFSVPEDQIEERMILGDSADMINANQQQGHTQNNSNGMSSMELDSDAVTDAKQQ
ncbi:hypothetical protein BY458DRAFT_505768 [Sporodiniella umbellata]|nr:hypothetical protein BY458DRAFT_505768 [Sporodiniella umbellata]